MATREIIGGEHSKLEVTMKNAIKLEMLRPDNKPHKRGTPVVYKDSSGIPNHSHYYVVWNRFDGLNQLIRSSVVYEAVNEAFGVEEAMRTVTAMGLTPKEAEEMGLTN